MHVQETRVYINRHGQQYGFFDKTCHGRLSWKARIHWSVVRFAELRWSCVVNEWPGPDH